MKMTISVLCIALVMACSPKKDTADSETVASESNDVQKEYLISPSEFKEKMDEGNVTIIDVRTPGEVANGFIPGAVHIDFKGEGFSDEIALLDKETTYMVYCHSGGRSARSRKLMNQQGFTEVYDLDGGITAWKEQGYDLVKE